MLEPGVGNVSHTGTGTSALTLVGQANGAYQLAVMVLTGGAVAGGACEIEFALDAMSPAGPNFMAPVVVPASGLVPVPGAGFSLQFDPTGLLVVDDTYSAPPIGARIQIFVAVVQWRLFLDGLATGWTWHFGAEFLKSQEAPPRVTWVPTKDVYGPLREQGANPRRRRTRTAGYEVHVWGSTRGATELMADQVQDHLYLAGYGSWGLHEGEWPNETGPDAGKLTNLGFYYVFTTSVKIPVTDAPGLTGQATSAALTPQLEVGNPPTPHG